MPGWSVPANKRGGSRRIALMYILMYTYLVLQRYSIAEARARLPRVVDAVEAGVEVELTRRGRPVAVLISRQEFDRLKGERSHFAETYREFLEKYSLEEIGLEPDFRGSTRDKSTGRKVSL
jgi:prevent-host-death family protein